MVRLEGGYTFYHAGDTALFSDMQLIAELYRPELAFLPIGDLLHHGPGPGGARLPLPRRAAGDPDPLGHLPAADRHPGQLEAHLSSLGIACQMHALKPGETVD